jgi:hypothetical protein
MWPRPLEVCARAVVATGLVLALSLSCGKWIVRPLLPMLAATVPRLDERFTVQGVDLLDDPAGERVELQANLAFPVTVRGTVIEPFGTGDMPPGGFLVTETVGGTLQYVDLLAIIALAWPAMGWREHLARWLSAMPLCFALVVLQLPATFAAELWGGVVEPLAPGLVSPLMVWSRFLMGGGGFALALLFGAIAIAASKRLARMSAPR